MTAAVHSPNRSRATPATLLGLASILLWSTTVAFFRSLSEQLGVYSAGALVYIAAGAIGCGFLALRGRLVPLLRTADRRYLLVCGGLMVAHTLLLFSAVGFAATRAQVITATVANYLWPALTLLLCVPLLAFRAHRIGLAAGTALGIAGVAAAVGAGANIPQAAAFGAGCGATAAVAAAGALCWAMYSNLGRRWGAASADGAMALFLLATGLALLGARFARGEHSTFTVKSLVEAAYMVAGPTLLAYVGWDTAARRGNLAVIAAASYLTPILSILITWGYLDVPIAPLQWLGAAAVVAGAITSKLSLRESAAQPG